MVKNNKSDLRGDEEESSRPDDQPLNGEGPCNGDQETHTSAQEEQNDPEQAAEAAASDSVDDGAASAAADSSISALSTGEISNQQSPSRSRTKESQRRTGASSSDRVQFDMGQLQVASNAEVHRDARLTAQLERREQRLLSENQRLQEQNEELRRQLLRLRKQSRDIRWKKK